MDMTEEKIIEEKAEAKRESRKILEKRETCGKKKERREEKKK